MGKGTTVLVTPGMDVTASFQVNINALTAGFHRLYTRGFIPPYQVTENGTPVTKGGWSLTGVRTFIKKTSPLPMVPYRVLWAASILWMLTLALAGVRRFPDAWPGPYEYVFCF
ncbi:hypothetical protein [Paraflavitalea speifideaquila]|uniref:hypothetical protein n=1 Tax=Paraflavitalea speifideaquila TaxID=3076558 RepID=UPI0028ECD211|nr:hypothetical protein [Paraflavitalea speifideiaquila]